MASPSTSYLETIWSDFYKLKQDDPINNIEQRHHILHKDTDQDQDKDQDQNKYINNSHLKCKNCESRNISVSESEFVCNDCGLVSDQIFSSTVFLNNDVQVTKFKNNYNNNNNQYCKIQKMQEWFMWTSEEKNSYKLSTYTKDLCTKLNIPEMLISVVCNTVNIVMSAIKKYEGTKRARVKDGIILSCIEYVANDNNLNISACDLAKKINLDIKYVTRADRIILELINNNKLNLKKNTALNVKTPIDYILNVINKNNLDIPEILIKKVKALIKFCETNDILIDHTPLSIGVCCFYYILKTHNIELDIKIFADLYDLSIVTILKTFNKLNIHSNVINRYLSQIRY
jgi:transcription initiation factor TFIIIB Brf1 subunit/transcription initiation factor TFIIB